MQRRAFLNMAGTLSAAAFVPASAFAAIPAPPAAVVSGGKHYRGTQDGKILVSTDAGASWALHADFSNGFAVVDLKPDGQGLRAQLRGANTRFDLQLNARGSAWTSA